MQLEAAVAGSNTTAERLEKIGIEVVDMNSVGGLDAYVDGADEIDRHMHMIKGGGAALPVKNRCFNCQEVCMYCG